MLSFKMSKRKVEVIDVEADDSVMTESEDIAKIDDWSITGDDPDPPFYADLDDFFAHPINENRGWHARMVSPILICATLSH
jgi:hypothetical protein